MGRVGNGAEVTHSVTLLSRLRRRRGIGRKLGLPNLSPAEWESAERQRECNYAVTNNGFVRLLARGSPLCLIRQLPNLAIRAHLASFSILRFGYLQD